MLIGQPSRKIGTPSVIRPQTARAIGDDTYKVGDVLHLQCTGERYYDVPPNQAREHLHYTSHVYTGWSINSDTVLNGHYSLK